MVEALTKNFISGNELDSKRHNELLQLKMKKLREDEISKSIKISKSRQALAEPVNTEYLNSFRTPSDAIRHRVTTYVAEQPGESHFIGPQGQMIFAQNLMEAPPEISPAAP